MADSYKVIRRYADPKIRKRTLMTRLTLEQAQAYCRHSETSSATCKNYEGRRRTALYGPWFDGYEVER